MWLKVANHVALRPWAIGHDLVACGRVVPIETGQSSVVVRNRRGLALAIHGAGRAAAAFTEEQIDEILDALRKRLNDLDGRDLAKSTRTPSVAQSYWIVLATICAGMAAVLASSYACLLHEVGVDVGREGRRSHDPRTLLAAIGMAEIPSLSWLAAVALALGERWY